MEMTVKTLHNMLAPRCKRYDDWDAIAFLKDTSINNFEKLEAIYGKLWPNIKLEDVKMLLESPDEFLKQLRKLQAYPIGY